jgi:hypothetical protein
VGFDFQGAKTESVFGSMRAVVGAGDGYKYFFAVFFYPLLCPLQTSCSTRLAAKKINIYKYIYIYKIKIKGKEARGFKMSSNMSSEVLDFFKWLYKFQIQSTKWQYVQRENKPKKNSNFAEKEP